MLLTRDEIKVVDDLPFKIVHIKNWGGDVKIRAMSTLDRISFENKNSKSKTELETMIYLIMYTCVLEDNSRLFNDSDYDLLASKSADVLLKLFETAIELSTLSKEGMEEKAKN